MKTEILRDYQQEMLQDLYKTWKRKKSVMVQMPTGTGKTHLMAAVIRETSPDPSEERGEQKGQILVVAHRRELIAQISQTLDNFGVGHGLIVSGKEIDYTQRVQVASIQTLVRRSLPLTPPKGEGIINPSLVIIDEAHHALAETYRMLWEKWPKAKYLGLTATPCRLSGEPFTDLFQVLLQSWSIQEFIDKGWLSDFEYVSARPDSEVMRQVRSLKKRGIDGDYQQKELATVMDVPESIEHLYKTYKQFADGKKGIVYAIDREHARHITAYYPAQRVNCCLIDGKTPAEDRKRLVTDYLEGTISVLVSIDCFSEGFDAPEVEFIQLARPTLSLSKYLQQVGRGMRVSPGKPHVLILDNVGLYQTFGLPTEERDWRQTFYGRQRGKGILEGSRSVILDGDAQDKELVNLQMVRIKKGGKRGVGLEIFIKDGRYGVRNNGRISCPARFLEIVRLHDQSGYFAAGIYSGKVYDSYVEFASLIDKKGVDQNLRLFRNVKWMDGYFYSRYLPKGYKAGAEYWMTYWDPKGNCYYDSNQEFQVIAGVEIADAREHSDNRLLCKKLRWSTGNVSPRFFIHEIYYNKYIFIARNYLVVKHDKNHAYLIRAFLDDSVIVQREDGYGLQQIFMDGRKGDTMKMVPPTAKPSIVQVKLNSTLKRVK